MNSLLVCFSRRNDNIQIRRQVFEYKTYIEPILFLTTRLEWKDIKFGKAGEDPTKAELKILTWIKRKSEAIYSSH